MLRIFGHFLPIPPLILVIVEGILLSTALCVVVGPGGYFPTDTRSALVQFAIVLSLSAILAMIAVGLYSADAFLDSRVTLIRVAFALILVAPIAFMISSVFAVLSRTAEDLGPYWPIKAAVTWFICLAVTRTLFARFSDLDVFKRRILVIGSGVRALMIAKLGGGVVQARFAPVAFINACRDPRLVQSLNCDLSKGPSFLEDITREVGAQEIVIATDNRRGLPTNQLLQCKLAGIPIIDYLTFCERELGRVDLDALQPSWFIFSDGFRVGWFSEFVKRSLDLVMSAAMFITVLPLLALTALAIKLEGPGPILYRQERVGLRGRIFVLLKFRSMRIDAEADGGPLWAEPSDPRVTRVGSVIRKFRIDELPQIFNVIRGDMSFVGPRPERPYFVERLARQIRFYNERHAARPGITGWAQINYPYGASEEDAREKLSYDLYYLKNRGLFLDLVILIQTARVILWPQGVR